VCGGGGLSRVAEVNFNVVFSKYIGRMEEVLGTPIVLLLLFSFGCCLQRNAVMPMYLTISM
jgi:hypothetical protein